MSLPDRNGNARAFFTWLKEWQELAAGMLAIGAALFASYPVWKQLRANNLQVMIQARDQLFARADGASAAISQLGSFRAILLTCPQPELQSRIGEYSDLLSSLSRQYLHAPRLHESILLAQQLTTTFQIAIALDPMFGSGDRIQTLSDIHLTINGMEHQFRQLLNRLRSKIIVLDERILDVDH